MESTSEIAALENTLQSLTKLGGRVAVAMACGYMDARTMVDLLQTHGFPLDLCAHHAAQHGLQVDWAGLRCELERIGKKPETISSLFREMAMQR